MCTRTLSQGCVPQSHNYDARGRRVNPSGGIYWIPAHDFRRAMETSRRDPRTLNCLRFEPVAAACAQTPSVGRT
jgi:hypothetical protein